MQPRIIFVMNLLGQGEYYSLAAATARCTAGYGMGKALLKYSPIPFPMKLNWVHLYYALDQGGINQITPRTIFNCC